MAETNELILRLRQQNKEMLRRFGLMTKIDKSSLSDEMVKNSSRMFIINSMKADAEILRDISERAITLIEAKVDKEIRSSGAKKTEASIKQRIARHPEVKKAYDKFYEARWKCNVCWAAVSAINQKGEQLSNLAYNYRKELEHGFHDNVKLANEKIKNLSTKEREDHE